MWLGFATRISALKLEKEQALLKSDRRFMIECQRWFAPQSTPETNPKHVDTPKRAMQCTCRYNKTAKSSRVAKWCQFAIITSGNNLVTWDLGRKCPFVDSEIAG